MEEARVNRDDAGVDGLKPRQQGGSPKGRKGVAAFQMDQMHVREWALPADASVPGTNETRRWNQPRPGRETVTRWMKTFAVRGIKPRLSTALRSAKQACSALRCAG
jgi:hypothetical protein